MPGYAPVPGYAPAPAPVTVPAPETIPVPPPLQSLPRRGTTDWVSNKGTKHIRFYIPLRNTKKISDEENATAFRPQALQYTDQRSSRAPPGAGEDPAYDQIDIVATQCIPDVEGRETISLTTKDKSESTEQKDLRYESRWR